MRSSRDENNPGGSASKSICSDAAPRRDWCCSQLSLGCVTWHSIGIVWFAALQEEGHTASEQVVQDPYDCTAGGMELPHLKLCRPSQASQIGERAGPMERNSGVASSILEDAWCLRSFLSRDLTPLFSSIVQLRCQADPRAEQLRVFAGSLPDTMRLEAKPNRLYNTCDHLCHFPLQRGLKHSPKLGLAN